MATLTAQDVEFRVNGVPLVHDVTISAQPGELLGVVGPNGAGKSTLMELLSRDRHPTAGMVALDERNLMEYGPVELAKLRAVLPQQTVVRFPFTAQDVVLMGRHPYHADPANSHERDLAAVRDAMTVTDTLELAERIFPSLSGGEQTRVALARILAQQTPVILLDEPTSTLDVHHQEHTMQVLRDRTAAGATVVAVLHDLNLAAAYADQLVLMAAGAIAASGIPRRVLQADLLTETYRQRMRVMDHPHRDCPLVVVE